MDRLFLYARDLVMRMQNFTKRESAMRILGFSLEQKGPRARQVNGSRTRLRRTGQSPTAAASGAREAVGAGGLMRRTGAQAEPKWGVGYWCWPHAPATARGF